MFAIIIDGTRHLKTVIIFTFKGEVNYSAIFSSKYFSISKPFTDSALIYIFKSCSVSFLKSSIWFPLT